MLGVLGLSPVAQAVYAAVLGHPGYGVAELTRTLSLTETQVRTACDELADLALLRPSHDTPGLLRAVNPAFALDLVLRRQEAELAHRASELAEERLRAAHLVAAYTDLDPGESDPGTERLLGLDAVQARLELLATQLTGECLSSVPGGGQSQAGLEAARPLAAEALRKGVRLLTLYQDSVRNDPASLAYAQWMTREGGQVRTAPLLPPRLVIFDRAVAVVPLDPQDARRGALCTREPAVVAFLVAVHQQAWDTAVPLAADRDEEAGGLTPTERDLLVLLSKGLTDEAAGKRLGVSLRTVRRQMAGLMERLGAASRFEAGLKAARRGWL